MATLVGVAVMSACGAESKRDIGEIPYALLSDYEFFDGPMAQMVPAQGVLPYTVAAPLFSDNAGKGRYIVLPEGKTMTVTEQDEWEIPQGTTIVKSFFFDTDRRDGPSDDDTRIVETRLLRATADGLKSHIYRWNDEQTDAEYIRAGADVAIPYTDAAGAEQVQDYIIPDENACGSCHERDDVLRVLGLSTHQLNRTVDGGSANQIAWLSEQGAIADIDATGLPSFPDPAGEMDLDARARAYLHGNCSHCHRPGGGGGASGLKFTAWVQDEAEFGVCKVPAAAGAGAGGNAYDIVPGHPESSIVVFRMASTDPEKKMPEVPTLLADEFGVDLITEWIAAMPSRDCASPED
ncbi:MAG: hypothetical protein JKY37_01050 [Nannocystaceae bacterium]|nr:hypothetical protein [Nannocystaceae bacterium]